jgi:hypothetical protein
MAWSSTKMKFGMDVNKSLAMTENATMKGVEAPENEIGSEYDRHHTEVMGEGEG